MIRQQIKSARAATVRNSDAGIRLVRPTRPPFRAWQSTQTPSSSKIDRITSKLPRRLQKYNTGLRNAPVSHVVSFLILHELTAIVPLFALFGLFHYTTYVPITYVTQHFGAYVDAGVSRFERYFKRKEWFGFSKDEDGKAPDSGRDDGSEKEDVMDKWQSGDQKYKIVVEVALAYAITKAFLPVRIIGSVWATPWFAGLLTKVRRAVTRKK
jgi:ribosome-associated translation inhibitor RaiA